MARRIADGSQRVGELRTEGNESANSGRKSRVGRECLTKHKQPEGSAPCVALSFHFSYSPTIRCRRSRPNRRAVRSDRIWRYEPPSVGPPGPRDSDHPTDWSACDWPHLRTRNHLGLAAQLRLARFLVLVDSKGSISCSVLRGAIHRARRRIAPGCARRATGRDNIIAGYVPVASRDAQCLIRGAQP